MVFIVELLSGNARRCGTIVENRKRGGSFCGEEGYKGP